MWACWSTITWRVCDTDTYQSVTCIARAQSSPRSAASTEDGMEIASTVVPARNMTFKLLCTAVNGRSQLPQRRQRKRRQEHWWASSSSRHPRTLNRSQARAKTTRWRYAPPTADQTLIQSSEVKGGVHVRRVRTQPVDAGAAEEHAGLQCAHRLACQHATCRGITDTHTQCHCPSSR